MGIKIIKGKTTTASKRKKIKIIKKKSS